MKERKNTLGVRPGEENDNEENDKDKRVREQNEGRYHRRIGVRSSYNGVDINLSSNIETDSKSKEESTDEQQNEEPDYKVYNFKDSEDGKSWQLGNDSLDNANAYIGGYSKCPKDIIVPRSLKNKENVTRPVEVIGTYAYNTCGNPNWGKETKTVLVTKQVKIIKYAGFGNMQNVESFRIEEGSVLQSIEQYGLYWIGYNTGMNDEKKRGTLTLPSTLSSVTQYGIFYCNIFKVIIYCGIHPLDEESELELNVNEKTKVKVTNQYPAETIFGRTPLKDAESQDEVLEKCLEISGNSFEKKSKSSPENKVLSIIPLLCILL